jgi:hypothetical protein
MGPRTHAVSGIVSHEHAVASIHPKSGAFGVIDEVVDYLDVIRLIVQPGRDHELKAGALPRGESSGTAVIEAIALDP